MPVMNLGKCNDAICIRPSSVPKIRVRALELSLNYGQNRANWIRIFHLSYHLAPCNKFD
jgi:hypothetical protein